MKIGMQTWGSHGDIRPMLALAEGLQAAGHEVSLFITLVHNADPQYLQTRHGVKIRMLASPVCSDEAAKQMGLQVFSTADPMRQLGLIMQHGYAPAEDTIFAAAQELCAEADLLIGHFILHPLQIAAERAAKPYITVLFSASLIPSKFITPADLPELGQIANRMYWWLARLAINYQVKKYPRRLRRQLGMPPPKDVLQQIWLSERMSLLAVSPQLCQAQADWPPHVKVCGFLDMPNLSVEGELPAALTAFLQAGPAPVYMTFGSLMPVDVEHHRAALELLSGAMQVAGCRAIIQSTMWQECGFSPSQQLMFVAATPHHLVFPHCRAILHHGGAGTTQSATLAGKPSIVLAHIAEQWDWGKQLHQRGIAARPIMRRNATIHNVAEALMQVLNAPEMVSRAEAIAQAMRQEDGVRTAVQLIEQAFPHLGPST